MTPEKVTVARQQHAAGEHTVAAIAQTLGVSRASIYRRLTPPAVKPRALLREEKRWTSSDGPILYDEALTVEFIEVSHSDLLTVRLDGHPVLLMSVPDAVRLLDAQHCSRVVDEDGGYTYLLPSLSLSLWRDAVPDDQDHEASEAAAHFLTAGAGVAGHFDDRAGVEARSVS